MNVAEMKKAIIEKVDKLTEQQLIEVNRFVEAIDNIQAKEYDLLPHVESIIAERQEVLKKLAQ